MIRDDTVIQDDAMIQDDAVIQDDTMIQDDTVIQDDAINCLNHLQLSDPTWQDEANEQEPEPQCTPVNNDKVCSPNQAQQDVGNEVSENLCVEFPSSEQ